MTISQKEQRKRAITGAIEGNTLVWLIALLVFAGVVLLILFFNYKPQLLGLWDESRF
jgi:hypothetical protein